MKVLYLPKVEIDLFNLIKLLYHEQYFSFPDQAIVYVQKIKQYIENNIKTACKQKVSEYFCKYGKKICIIPLIKRMHEQVGIYFSNNVIMFI
jgi:hypothetical protein